VLVYFINHSVAPDNLGGAERSMIKLVEDWYASDPDFEAFFITKAPRGRFIEAIEKRGWNYRAFPYRGWMLHKPHTSRSELTYSAHYDYSSTLEIITQMEQRRPDLVVTNTIVAPWGAFAAKTLGIPHAWFVREYGDLDHGLTFQNGRENTFSDIGLMSEAVFTNSLAMRSHIGQYLDASKVTVVYPEVNAPQVKTDAALHPTIAPFPQADPGLRLTVVGRLNDSKGQRRVVEALGLLKNQGVTASVCLVGSCTEPHYDLQLMLRAKELGVDDHVTLVGEQTNPFPYIAAADVCVTPSSIEAFGRTTLDAMTLGKPVVASSTGGSAELVVHGTTGFLFEADAIDQLAEHLKRYSTDPELIAAHGSAGETRATSLMSDEFSNAAAIERMRVTAAGPAYQLPQMARYWFSLPGHYFSVRRAPQITIGFIVGRLSVRARGILMQPVNAIRRLGFSSPR